MENGQEELAQAIEFAHHAVDLAEAVKRLEASRDFQMLMGTFIQSFMGTTVGNFSRFTQEQRRGSIEQLLARSVFMDTLDSIKLAGQDAKDALANDLVEDEG